MNQPTTRNPTSSPDTVGSGDRGMQGEGNYDAARRYRKGVEKFVRNASMSDAARKAGARSIEEAREIEAAEKLGRARSMGDSPADPALMQDQAGSGSGPDSDRTDDDKEL